MYKLYTNNKYKAEIPKYNVNTQYRRGYHQRKKILYKHQALLSLMLRSHVS